MDSPLDSVGVLAKGAGVVFVGTVLGRALGFLGQVVIVRSLSPHAFGRIALAYTIVHAVAGIAVVGLPQGVTRLIAASNTDDQQREFFHGGLLSVFAVSSMVALLVYVSRFQISELMGNDQLPILLVLFLPYLVIFPVSQIMIAVLRARKDSVSVVLSRDLVPPSGALALFAVFAFVGRSFLGALVYWLSIPVLVAALAARYVHSEFAIRDIVTKVPQPTKLRELWSFSWPLAFESSFVLLLSNLDILMIGYFLNNSAVGQYRAIQPLQQVTLFALTSVIFLYLPIATEHYGKDDLAGLDAIYTISTKWVTAMTLPLVLVFSLFSPDVIRVFFGSEYLPAAPALTVLIAGLFFRAIVGPSGATIKAIDRPKVELFASLCSVVVNVGANLLLIPSLGIVGAAIATVLGFAVFNMIEVMVIYRLTGSHPFSADNIKSIVPTTLVAFVLLYLTDGVSLGLIALVLIGIALAGSQLASMVFTRSLDEMDLYLIERIESRTGVEMMWLKSQIQ